MPAPKRFQSSTELNAALRKLYASGPWDLLSEIREERLRELGEPTTSRMVGSPFLSAATDAYTMAEVRLLIVGREAVEWGTWQDGAWRPFAGITEAMNVNQNYLETNTNRGPLMAMTRRAARELNPGVPGRPIAWSDVFRLDECGTTPGPELQRSLLAAPELVELLRRELEILEPDVLWVAAGIGGDGALAQTLPALPSHWERPYTVVHGTPYAPVVFRSDHPRALQQHGHHDSALNCITAEAAHLGGR